MTPLIAILLAQIAGLPGQIQTPNAGRWVSTQGTYQCTGTGCVSRPISSKEGDWLSILDFGCVGDDSTDNSTCLQNAITQAATNNNGLFIPAGTYRYTVTPTVPFNISIRGIGQGSVLKPVATDGLLLTGNGLDFVDYINFRIVGTGALTGKVGIRHTTTYPNRSQGLTFRNLDISGTFDAGFDVENLWEGSWRDISIEAPVGIVFRGENIFPVIDRARFVKTGAVNGGGTAYGIRNILANGRRVQDLVVSNSQVFGFDRAVELENILHAKIVNSEFDFSQERCVRVTTGNGGIYIKNNWCSIDAASSFTDIRGIEFVNLGGANDEDKVIEANHLLGKVVATSIGIYVGWNQNRVVVADNYTNNLFSYGLDLQLVTAANVRGNVLNGGSNSIVLGTSSATALGNTLSGAASVSSDSQWLNAPNANRVLPTYANPTVIDASLGSEFVVIVTNGSNFGINAPTNAPIAGGQRITVRVRNSSGGTMGAITWGAGYKMMAWKNPDNGNSRSVDFQYEISSGNWFEVSRTDFDIPETGTSGVTQPVPVVGTSVLLTAQTANLAAQNVYASAPVGEYRVCVNARTTTSGSGTTANVNIIWTDDGGAKTDAVGTWALNSISVTGQINKCEYIHSAAAQAIQVSVTAGTYGTSVYALSATAERLN